MRQAKFHTIYSQPDGVREEIPALKGKDADVLGVKVAGVDLVPDADGKVDVPIAKTGQYGLVKYRSDWSGYGISTILSTGDLCIARPTYEEIDGKSQAYKPITPISLDYSVRAGLKSNSFITEADKLSICKTIGAVQKLAGGWELKGSIIGDENDRGNIDDGANVDLTGCTELMIHAKVTATANVYLWSDRCLLSYAFAQSGNRNRVVIWQDSPLGIVPIVDKYVSDMSNNLVSTGNAYCVTNGQKIGNMRKIYFPADTSENVTYANIEIYAR